MGKLDTKESIQEEVNKLLGDGVLTVVSFNGLYKEIVLKDKDNTELKMGRAYDLINSKSIKRRLKRVNGNGNKTFKLKSTNNWNKLEDSIVDRNKGKKFR